MSKNNTTFTKSDVIGFSFVAALLALLVAGGVNLVIHRVNETPTVWCVVSYSDRVVFNSYDAGAKPVGTLEESMVVELDHRYSDDGKNDWIMIENNQWIKVNEFVDIAVFDYFHMRFPEGTRIYNEKMQQIDKVTKNWENIKVIAVQKEKFVACRDGSIVYIKR